MRTLFLIILFTFQAISPAAHVPRVAQSPSGDGSKFQCKPCKRADTQAENKAPDVTALDLDKTELKISNAEKGGEPARDLLVDVKTTAEDPEGDVLVFNYTISGGRIVGSGANVRWDLSKVRPGTYTITAGVDDGCGLCGKTMSQTVTVVEG